MKKISTLFAVLLMAVTSGFAAEFIDFGTCGYALNWQLDSRGILYIFLEEGSATGAMTDFEYASAVPWSGYASTIKTVSMDEGVTSIGSYAFKGCSKLSSINLPEGLTAIGQKAFEDCSALAEIQLPQSLNFLGEGVFESCGVEELVFPKGVSLPRFACWTCSSLRSVQLPSDLDTIPWYAFNHCSSLQTIEIPQSVKYIGGNAFAACTSIGSVTCRAIMPPEMGISVFYDSNIKNKSLYVPSGSEDAYARESQWSDFWVKTLPKEEVTSCEFTGFDISSLYAGMEWTEDAEYIVWRHVQPVEADVPYHAEPGMVLLFKDEAVDANTVAYGTILTEGSYIISGQMRIDGEYGSSYCFPQGGEGLEVTMDGTLWTVDMVVLDNNYSFAWINSPAFTLEKKKEGVEKVQGCKVQSTKVLRNGQLLIERNGKMFNAQGAEL